MNQCFKIKSGTDYDKAVKKYFTQRPSWKNVMDKVGNLLNENITLMAHDTDDLYIDIKEIHSEENKKLFTKNGKLKTSTNRGKEIAKQYYSFIQEEKLSDFKDLQLINFAYGVIRLQGQKLERFVSSEHDIYYKADFNLEERAKGLVFSITEVEYEEKYLDELKKRSE